ncbi:MULTISPECIES: hypothetical protein [Mycobacterium]|uniref:LppP/LprE family lipoprotein n=1 Tax=Mycobacterium kiyosense TaxID=2871094 RepID=A0A9P3Q6S2_9MYCO|nr:MULTISPECIES: hypothetical protein [Mycobacterium]BDB40344.1 hypothetical protein IWGMT90018_07900 [Mycobacterium kiyosense]BDE12164.1 hypothetical protein MKCMC460_10240 [Mycobacterium sp. 20KCMC460]GLB86387.1 hypothetical protein SRL2020028_56430 [Mycobacterium kiyosense]GLB88681.1 hypothetical protein SRL2020130_14980 [Mycobacterium kiyosense]GLB95049.1 hypothetical protein SRL2020226_18250 [Mycobacterium kiyosense]
MTIKAFPAVIALMAGLGLIAAPAPAQAEALMADGTYHYADDDGDTGTWTIRTTCAPHCVAHVTTASGRSFDARLENGRFVSFRLIPDGLECPTYLASEVVLGGGTHPVLVTQWWDPITLSGEVEFSHSAPPCALDDQHDRFTLTRIG